MVFEARGGPLHTRSLSVSLTQAEPPLVAFHGYVLDLRKRGFAPVGGDVQATGIVHHMEVDGTIDATTGRIVTITSRMPTVAFEPKPATGGDTCRNVGSRTALLEGVSLGDAFARSVGAAIGGPRGCSHILTLTLLLGPTVEWALAQVAAGPDAWRPGERLFRRDISIDGYELPSTDLVFTAQLNDLWCRPAPADAAPMEHFDRQIELRVSVQAGFQKMVIQAAAAEERRRSHADFLEAEWIDRSARLATLEGQSMRHGITQTLLAEFADAGADAPLRDMLLQIPPTSIQCYAALDLWRFHLAGATAAADTGGWPDSCYIWRRDGYLTRVREAGLAGLPKERA
jgi:Protein of unknown function (DUF2889)